MQLNERKKNAKLFNSLNLIILLRNLFLFLCPIRAVSFYPKQKERAVLFMRCNYMRKSNIWEFTHVCWICVLSFHSWLFYVILHHLIMKHLSSLSIFILSARCYPWTFSAFWWNVPSKAGRKKCLRVELQILTKSSADVMKADLSVASGSPGESFVSFQTTL